MHSSIEMYVWKVTNVCLCLVFFFIYTMFGMFNTCFQENGQFLDSIWHFKNLLQREQNWQSFTIT